ncbi:MAG: DUF4956 domain-containing protein [Lachnospiraceae bacterium]|nr:DUF4956 domain-containing protein [Lachnospiraceae bacterium]
MSVKDVIKNSVLQSALYDNSLSSGVYTTIVVDMLVALLIGYIIYRIYKRFFSGVVYSRSFAVTLIGMTALTCMVTLAISTNIVISLGMVGALSIVRYRTAIKEPLDIMYLFWAITEGITIGASMYVLAAIGMVIMLVIIIGMSRMKERKNAYVCILHYSGDDAKEAVLSEFKTYVHSVKSIIEKDDSTEMTVQIDMKKDDGISGRLKTISGVRDVTLIQYNGDYHG